MAVEKVFAALLLLAVTLGSVTSDACYPPCSSVRDTFYYPKWDDCKMYYECRNGQTEEKTCPNGQVFDFYKFTCHPKPSGPLPGDPVFSCDVLLNGLSPTQG